MYKVLLDSEPTVVSGTLMKLDNCDLDFLVVKEARNYSIYELYTGLKCYNGSKSQKETISNFRKGIASNNSFLEMLKHVKELPAIERRLK